MIKLTKIYNKVTDILEELEDMISRCEEKRDTIESKALDKDRDMTEKEQERYDELDIEIDAICSFRDELENALYNIEEYCDL